MGSPTLTNTKRKMKREGERREVEGSIRERRRIGNILGKIQILINKPKNDRHG